MLKRWENKADEEERIKEEINNVSTTARQVDEYVRNELSKKVENIDSIKSEITNIKDYVDKHILKLTKELELSPLHDKSQLTRLQIEIDDINIEIKKIKDTLNDVIDYLNGGKKFH